MINENEIRCKRGEEYPIASIDTTVQKLPVVILVDTSGSMADEISKVNAAINKMICDIKNDSIASRQVELCIISFNDVATLEQNWKPVTQMETVNYTSGGCTNLKAGLTLALDKSLERSRYYEAMGMEIRMPFLITITDGYANGPEFKGICNEIRRREENQKIRSFTIAVNDYDRKTVAELSSGKRVLEFTDPNNHNYLEFFNFMTQSLKKLSQSHGGDKITVESNLGDPDKGSTMQAPDLSAWLN